ncbi:hypothetical protein [Streptomyces noursei]|uniref:Uncharacterized protein n=1 Tax=Streptomyces noursei TaxID=1971 RepID=A0A2N8PJ90_STRNR|nr:hypothetical protein [Streptomyces noursei]PNE41104.1 hypothetical protein AOB60_10295 [Streptomyces noursei]
MIAGDERPSHRAAVTTASPTSDKGKAQACRSTWNPSFGAACHCHGFAPSGRGGMSSASSSAGFQVQVLCA